MSIGPDCILHLVRVVGKDFVAAFETDGRKVLVTAPFLKRYIHGLSTDEARAVILEEGWQATHVKRQLTEPRLIQHDESFEVQKDGLRAFYYFDDVASRRAIKGRADKVTAYGKAKAYLDRQQ